MAQLISQYSCNLQALWRAETTGDAHDAHWSSQSALQGTTGRWMAVGGHLELSGALLLSMRNRYAQISLLETE